MVLILKLCSAENHKRLQAIERNILYHGGFRYDRHFVIYIYIYIYIIYIPFSSSILHDKPKFMPVPVSIAYFL
jgi:hypothetical protein